MYMSKRLEAVVADIVEGIRVIENDFVLAPSVAAHAAAAAS